MLRKRLIGVVTVRDGWAVQSFGYRRFLPLGRPEIIVENLDRWGADEILVQCVDRSRNRSGPNFELLERIAGLGLSTPLIYGGGIDTAAAAVEVVRLGADRVAVDAMLHDDPAQLEAVARELGTQAIVAHMPVRSDGKALWWLDYRSGEEKPLSQDSLPTALTEWTSEVMLSDWRNEGSAEAFDETIPSLFPVAAKPLILFGGLSAADQIQRMLSQETVVAAATGNFLSYGEHRIQTLKRTIFGVPLRPAHHASEKTGL